MQRWKDWAAVGVILLLLPYIAVTFMGNQGAVSGEKEGYTGRYYILVDNGGTSEKMDLETYVKGAASAVLEPDSQEETVKALMILIRTNVVREMDGQEQERQEQAVQEMDGQEQTAQEIDGQGQAAGDAVPAKLLTEPYQEPGILKKRLGEGFDDFYQKLEQASAATRGLILTCDGAPVEAAYHRVSNGKTRNGEEVLGEGYSYLQSVDSSRDIYSGDYLLRREIPESEWESALAGAGFAGDSAFEVLERDSAGYVLRVSIGGSEMAGEAFRELFSLNSGDFTVEAGAAGKIVTTKGVGHGLGMSLYGADQMALEGRSYEEILSAYFQGIQLKKIE